MSHQLSHALASRTAGRSVPEVLQQLAADYPGGVTFSTSFSNEDQVITHLITRSGAAVELFTLDTGRLFQATHDVWQSTLTSLGVSVRPYFPDAAALQEFTQAEGPNPFYRSPELRKRCCELRKVAPLKAALRGRSIWITGLRAEHSPDRSDIPQFEWDEANAVVKFHPLLHWTTEHVSRYIREHHLPYNALGDKGFVSIGCEPCTRAIRPGEDFRAGRWWWEDSSRKECGLHSTQTNQLKTEHHEQA